MAERKGPGQEGHDPVESGQQDDRADLGADRQDDAPVEHAADAETARHGDVTSGDGESGAGTEINTDEINAEEIGTSETETSETDTETDTASIGKVVPLTPRADSDHAVDALADDALIDLDDADDEPIDLAALQSDDALLDALGGTDPAVPGDSSGAAPALETLLVAWRRDVDATPIDDLVDVETAVSVITEARRPKRKIRKWHLVPVASAAAVLMIMCAGVGLAAREALPGDMLWSVAKVFYSDHAHAAEARENAKNDLEEAEWEWNRGNIADAGALLDSAEQYMQDVDKDHGLALLQETRESLAAKFGDVVSPPSDSSSVSSSEVPSGSSDQFPTSTSDTVPSETDTSVPSSSEDSSDTTTIPSESSDSSSHPASGSASDSSFPLWPTQ